MKPRPLNGGRLDCFPVLCALTLSRLGRNLTGNDPLVTARQLRPFRQFSTKRKSPESSPAQAPLELPPIYGCGLPALPHHPVSHFSASLRHTTLPQHRCTRPAQPAQATASMKEPASSTPAPTQKSANPSPPPSLPLTPKISPPPARPGGPGPLSIGKFSSMQRWLHNNLH